MTCALAPLHIEAKRNPMSSLPSPVCSAVGSPNKPQEPGQDFSHDEGGAKHPDLHAPELSPSSAQELDASLPELPLTLESSSPSTATGAEKEQDDTPLSASCSESEQGVESVQKASPRKCNFCGATSTPMWRHGPGEYTNLCNSCGVKWRRGKILSQGDNRHHLCMKAQKAAAAALKKNHDVSGLATPSSVSSAEKRKFSDVNDVRTSEIVRSEILSYPRRARSTVARQLWTADYGSSSDESTTPAPVFKKPKKTEVSPLARLKTLTNDFAALLERLSPGKAVAFTSVLANGFEEIVAKAYQAGEEVEMSVLDISAETWTALNEIAC